MAIHRNQPRGSDHAEIRFVRLRLAPLTAFICENSGASQDLQTLLRELGVETQCASDFERLQSAATEIVPDLIFIDVRLDVDWAALSYAGCISTAFVAVGGVADHARILSAVARGADEYLVKPFDRTVLKSKLLCLGFDV